VHKKKVTNINEIFVSLDFDCFEFSSILLLECNHWIATFYFTSTIISIFVLQTFLYCFRRDCVKFCGARKKHLSFVKRNTCRQLKERDAVPTWWVIICRGLHSFQRCKCLASAATRKLLCFHGA